jgi:GTP pyrophosphokinase
LKKLSRDDKIKTNMSEEKLKKLISLVKKYYPTPNLEIIERAYEFASLAHEGQKRKNGEPYLNHAYNTAVLLAKWKMPPAIVAAGLLHDVLEDTGFTFEDIKKEFGEEIASIVEGETKLSRLSYQGIERYAENLKKMFLAMAKDIRVIIIKFADRLDNLQTLNVFPPEKQKRIALESLEIYASIANRLGMGVIRRELEDLSFKYLYPQEFEWVSQLCKERQRVRENYLLKIKKIIIKDLRQAGISVISVESRLKGLYSTYKKLLKYDRDINQIYDLVACRIIVPTLASCYTTLGILHTRWKPLKGRIKDYIAQPKPNGYQSLHTTVFCENGEIVEFQIRTQEMHEQAEFGLAAHWFYKEKGQSLPMEKKYLEWLKELAKLQQEIQDRNKFLSTLDSLKIDFFQNRIFVFTPKGDVVDLPEGATPIDFAYIIHTEIGNQAIGARVNNRLVPLDYSLQSGDMVEIITNKKRKGPNPDWLKFVKTRTAKEKIRSQTKKFRLGNLLQKIISYKK